MSGLGRFSDYTGFCSGFTVQVIKGFILIFSLSKFSHFNEKRTNFLLNVKVNYCRYLNLESNVNAVWIKPPPFFTCISIKDNCKVGRGVLLSLTIYFMFSLLQLSLNGHHLIKTINKAIWIISPLQLVLNCQVCL